jgi:hypothetical protein
MDVFTTVVTWAFNGIISVLVLATGKSGTAVYAVPCRVLETAEHDNA